MGVDVEGRYAGRARVIRSRKPPCSRKSVSRPRICWSSKQFAWWIRRIRVLATTSAARPLDHLVMGAGFAIYEAITKALRGIVNDLGFEV